MLDHRLDLRQFDPLVHAHRFARQVGREREAAAWALLRRVIDNPVRVGAERSAMALVPGLGTSGAGLLAALLAVRGRRLRRGARGLLRPLQPQHQLDQLRLAQPLKFVSLHVQTESAIPPHCKGVGNYGLMASS